MEAVICHVAATVVSWRSGGIEERIIWTAAGAVTAWQSAIGSLSRAARTRAAAPMISSSALVRRGDEVDAVLHGDLATILALLRPCQA